MKHWKLLFIALLSLTCLGLSSCDKNSNKNGNADVKTLVVSKKSYITQLFFNGTIQPIEIVPVTTAVEGVITGKFFEFGQSVKQGDKLFTMESKKLQDDYQDAFTDFIGKKQSYLAALTKYRNTQNLFKEGIVSSDSFRGDRDAFDTANLAYFRSQQKLNRIIKQVPGLNKDLTELKPSDFAQIKKILSESHNRLAITAATSGVALFPKKTGSQNDASDETDIDVGSNVKEGQVLVSIGDLSGFSIPISVNEVDINRVKAGQAVTVTGDSFPKIQLKGIVKSVDAQAKDAGEGGEGSLAKFTVTVVVPKVSAQESKQVHVGMSAKVELTIQNPPAIMIPINAVSQSNGASSVQLMDANGKVQSVPVSTGQTSPDGQVAIESGLKAGDKIVLP